MDLLKGRTYFFFVDNVIPISMKGSKLPPAQPEYITDRGFLPYLSLISSVSLKVNGTLGLHSISKIATGLFSYLFQEIAFLKTVQIPKYFASRFTSIV